MSTITPSYNRKMIVGILLAATFVALLNQTLLIVALPSVMQEFNIEASLAQWVTTAFMLMSGVMIPITAFLVEKFSSKALLISSLCIFIVGTIIGAVAVNFEMLLVARITQAIGAGIIMPLMQTVLLIIFPPDQRGAAMGMSGMIIGFAPAIGPTLGGWLIDQFSWRALFYTVVPIAVIVLILAFVLMKNVTEQKQVHLDVTSVILSSLGWGGLLYGFSIVGATSWTNPQVSIALVIGAISLILFTLRQNKLEQPMLSFKVFHSMQFTLTTLLSVFMFATMISIETILPLYIQNIRGGNAIQSGVLLLPGAILMGFMAPITGKLFDKYGAKWMSVGGFSFILLAVVLYIQINSNTTFLFVGIAFTLMMFGVSLLMTPLMTAGMNALPLPLIPHGTAMSSTIRTVGASIGTAIVVSIMSAGSLQSDASSPALQLLDGIHTSFFAIGFIAIVGILLSLSIRQKRLES